MGIGAINNTTAFDVYKDYVSADNSLKKNMSDLSSGRKGVGDDPAGVSISERMKTTITGTSMARQNVQNGISVMRTADGWMQQTNDILVRMKELAVEAVDDTKSSQDRSNIQTEFKQMQDELQRIVDSAKFNGKNLLDGNLSGAKLQIGPSTGESLTINITDMNSVISGAVSAGTTVSTVGDASAAIGEIQSAVNLVSEQRAELGGQMSRMETTIGGLLDYESNIQAAESKIRDVDMAKAATEKAENQALTQVANAMLTQANQLPSQVVQLLR